MCSRSFENSPEINQDVYKPSERLHQAFVETARSLTASKEFTTPIGRKIFGAQHYVTAGWFYNETTQKLDEIKMHWFERGPIANFLLNPYRPRITIKHISVAQIEPVIQENGETILGPYRLFFYNTQSNRIDTCDYDNYTADVECVNGLGASEIMREKLTYSRQIGADVLTPQTESDLMSTLSLGNSRGWEPLQTFPNG